jgi:hypothetical protein
LRLLTSSPTGNDEDLRFQISKGQRRVPVLRVDIFRLGGSASLRGKFETPYVVSYWE